MKIRSIAVAGLAVVSLLSVVLGSGAASAAPSNDNFATATVVPSLPYSQTIDTTGSTTEPTEPDAVSSCAAAGASVWYAFTPADTTKLTATTSLSKISAIVGVYTGPSLDSLTLVGCDTEVNFVPTAGTTYYFQVGDTEVDAGGNFFSVEGIVTFDLDLYAPNPVCDGCPTFINYQAPNSMSNANGAGETSIGVNEKTNATMFLMTTTTAKVTWDDAQNPPKATWANVSSAVTNKITFDPIMFTDREIGRTYVGQLVVAAPLVVGVPAPGGVGGSLAAYSDDDGATWIPMGFPQANPSWDHESIGGGPYPASSPLSLSGIHAVYYCAQMGPAFCSRSDTGGVTWHPAVPAGSPLTGCQGLHGHIQVAPNGTVYVPFRSCSGGQGYISSTDAGVTWAGHAFRNIGDGNFDPQMAFDKAGRGYYIAPSNGKPLVMVSDKNGQNWGTPIDVGHRYHVRNTEFVMATAGDDGRAAVAFYGTPNEGNDQTPEYTGVWHLYIALTYDAGVTWQTVDATPTDPVQRGCIWAGGISPSNCRNLLDFQGMTFDKYGRVLVGYADGCTSSTCIGPNGTPGQSRASRGTIARQTTGKGLVAAYDGLF